MFITFIKRMYLIFILLPVAICYAIAVMLWTILVHLYDSSVIKKKY
jgi:hypothetical protein